jgi:enamine deaminase RidA (YjgF/YER057c/UK114 family)
LLAVFVIFAATLGAQPQTRPIKRPPNNQLAIERSDAVPERVDSPASVTGVTSQLVFHVSPLSSKGMLSQQVDNALKALDKANGAATILKLRAFVAGTGDLRRVQSIVNEFFAQKKWPLPVVTTVQVGAFPLEGAQVMLESISEEKKTVNPSGLMFVPAVEGTSGAAAIRVLADAMGSSTALRVSCFANSLGEAETARAAAAQTFPDAAIASVQSTRYNMGSRVICEGVAQNGPVRNAKLLFAAPQIGFGEDGKAAFDHVDHALEPLNASRAKSVMLNVYGTSLAAANAAKTLAAPIPTTAVFIEGLPALDATIEIEAVIPID